MVYVVRLNIIAHLDLALLGIRAVHLGSSPKACSRLFRRGGVAEVLRLSSSMISALCHTPGLRQMPSSSSVKPTDLTM